MKKIATLLLTFGFFIAGTGCKDSNGNDTTMQTILLGLQQNGIGGFAGSCALTASGLCTNYISGTTVSAVQSACTGGGGTYASSKCTTTNAVASCNTTSGGAKTETVFYNPGSYPDVTSATTFCTAPLPGGLGGTIENPYVP